MKNTNISDSKQTVFGSSLPSLNETIQNYSSGIKKMITEGGRKV